MQEFGKQTVPGMPQRLQTEGTRCSVVKFSTWAQIKRVTIYEITACIRGRFADMSAIDDCCYPNKGN